MPVAPRVSVGLAMSIRTRRIEHMFANPSDGTDTGFCIVGTPTLGVRDQHTKKWGLV